ncbi:MAG: hypothetical protein ABJB55_01635 [Actinomycetota bacterium]
MRTTPRTTQPSRIAIRAEEIKRFLASDTGRTVRRVTAAGLVIGFPLVMRIPVLRRHPILRVAELLGGVALIVKLAEAMRDWEPRTPIRLDVE